MMHYRTLGRTGLQVSEIGLGCEGFAGHDLAFTNEILDYAMAEGVNCMDLYSPDPELRSNLGQALKGRRDKMILQGHLCTAWQDGQYKKTRDMALIKPAFADLLTRLQTDYVDIGMIHYVDTLADWELVQKDILPFALEQKAAGHIRHIGISSHNPTAALAAAKSGVVDVIMFSINPCYDLIPDKECWADVAAEENFQGKLCNIDPVRAELYETCQRLGVGITVMKVFAGGDLLSDKSPAGKALTVNQCIHYALTRPAVASVLSGFHTLEEVKTSLAYEHASEAERDYAAAFAAFPRISWEGHCMYCGHCAPCPKGISVAQVSKFYHLCKAQNNVPETVREHYAALEHHAGECIGCGQCESRCPFGVAIRKTMEQAKAVFGY